MIAFAVIAMKSTMINSTPRDKKKAKTEKNTKKKENKEKKKK
jgi:hypothetical protein